MRDTVAHEGKLTLHDEEGQNAAANSEQRRREDRALHKALRKKFG